jgi:hypothetical protein
MVAWVSAATIGYCANIGEPEAVCRSYPVKSNSRMNRDFLKAGLSAQLAGLHRSRSNCTVQLGELKSFTMLRNEKRETIVVSALRAYEFWPASAPH